jgi:hypothetical protein
MQSLGPEEFHKQLHAMGRQPTLHEGGKITLPFTVPVGKFGGSAVVLGFAVAPNFPFECPTGPHVSPQLLPLHPGNDIGHPGGGVHPSDEFARLIGGDCQYWSRPFPGWSATDKSVRTYLAFINSLFLNQ